MSVNESSPDELRASRRRAVVAADDERRSIERELHDGAMQYLVSFGVNLQLARGLVDTDPRALTELLDELLRGVHDALNEVRELAWRVFPSVLTDSGLGDALRSAAAEAPIPVVVNTSAIDRYSPGTEATIYFCCIQLLEAAAESGRRATIRVRSETDAVLFDVTVEGAEFEDWARRDLANVRDRLGAFNGVLTVAPELEPKETVRISCAIPREPDGQAMRVEPSSASAR